MIKWTEKAKKAIDEIYNFIALDNPENARKFTHEIFNASVKLEELPLIGRIVPELGYEKIREIIHANKYRIIYLIKADGNIDILTVRHTSQVFKI